LEVNIDAILSGLVLILMITSTLSFVFTAAYGPLEAVQEHELENVANTILDRILLTPGSPSDWGSNIAVTQGAMTSFGLAKEGSTTLMDLDPSKVMRLADPALFPIPRSLHIDPIRAATLLGLRSDIRYGFLVTITPALNISATQVSNVSLYKGGDMIPSVLSVGVLSYDLIPAANAEVRALIVLSVLYPEKDQDLSEVYATTISATTDWQGRCVVNATGWLAGLHDDLSKKELKKSYISVMVYAEYHGITSAVVFDFGSTIRGGSIGDYLFVNASQVYVPGQKYKKKGQYTLMFNASQLIVLPDHVIPGYLINVTGRGWDGYKAYRVSTPLIDQVVAAYLIGSIKKDYYSIAFPRPLTPITFGTGAPSAMKTAVLRRVVRIGGLHFLFELKVWREVEP